MEEGGNRSDIKKLSVAERILLVEDICNSIAADQEALNVTEAQRVELARRIVSHHASPGEGAPWEEVENRLKAAQ